MANFMYEKTGLHIEIYEKQNPHDMIVVIDHDDDPAASIILNGKDAKKLVNEILAALKSPDRI